MREDGAITGQEWLQGAVSDIRRDELRALAKAAGVPVESNSKWRTVLELQEALMAYLVQFSGAETPDEAQGVALQPKHAREPKHPETRRKKWNVEEMLEAYVL